MMMVDSRFSHARYLEFADGPRIIVVFDRQGKRHYLEPEDALRLVHQVLCALTTWARRENERIEGWITLAERAIARLIQPGLMPDGGGMASYPCWQSRTRGKMITELIEELQGLVEEALSQLEARLEDLKRIAIPGKLRQKYVSCGKPNCSKCPHGPYWYLKLPDGREKYVRREDVAHVKAGIEAWEEAQKLEAELEMLRERWRAIRCQLEWLALDLSCLTPCPGAPRGGKT